MNMSTWMTVGSAIVSSTQTAYQVGALVAFGVGFGTSTIQGDWSWRAASLTMISLALGLMVIAYFLPESPRWLLQRYPDDKQRALTGLARVRRLPADDPEVVAEFRELVLALEYQRRHEPSSYKAFFKNKAMHKRVAFGCGTMFISQLCGSSALLFYGIIQFRSLGFEGGTWGMKLNVISGSIQLVACAIAFLVVDRWGRRPVFLWELGTMVGSYVITAALSNPYPNAVSQSANIVSVICIYVIQSAYSGGLGPLAWIYASEIFPTHYRDKGINISQAAQQTAILILNQVWPVMFANLSHNAYWILAGFNTIGFIVVFFLWPETKGISLEQMDVVFGSINRVETALQEGSGGNIAGEESEKFEKESVEKEEKKLSVQQVE